MVCLSKNRNDATPAGRHVDHCAERGSASRMPRLTHGTACHVPSSSRSRRAHLARSSASSSADDHVLGVGRQRLARRHRGQRVDARSRSGGSTSTDDHAGRWSIECQRPPRRRARHARRHVFASTSGTSGSRSTFSIRPIMRERRLDRDRVRLDERGRASTAAACDAARARAARSPAAHASHSCGHQARRGVRHVTEMTPSPPSAITGKRQRVVAGQHGEARAADRA